MKYNIAIVEDQDEQISLISEFIKKYGEDNQIEFITSVFKDGKEIIDHYNCEFDIIFFDIEMPFINGMEAAKMIRKTDQSVVIVFITNLAQYAIEGYSVGALDFVLKPIGYYPFTLRLERALERVRKKETRDIVLNLPEGIKRLNTNDIFYVELENRKLHYFTVDGEFIIRGTMGAAEEELKDYHFNKCNQCYLVNLKCVTAVDKNFVTIANKKLEISRRSRSLFISALTDFIGGGI